MTQIDNRSMQVKPSPRAPCGLLLRSILSPRDALSQHSQFLLTLARCQKSVAIRNGLIHYKKSVNFCLLR